MLCSSRVSSQRFRDPTPPFPTCGLPRDGFPAFIGTMKALRLPCEPSVPASLFARRRLPWLSRWFCVLQSNSASRRNPPTPPGIGKPGNPCPVCCAGNSQDLPASQAAPRVYALCSEPRQDLRARPARHVGSVPVLSNARDSCNASISRLYHTASRPLCTLHAPVTRHDATLACGVVANLSPLPVFHRERLRQNGFSYSLPPFSELSLARWRRDPSSSVI